VAEWAPQTVGAFRRRENLLPLPGLVLGIVQPVFWSPETKGPVADIVKVTGVGSISCDLHAVALQTSDDGTCKEDEDTC
jgi:hypothetical protein